ncbi:undecaprenyldiphospho-muramoylpentapeptide beta-N-acetylglucosaminyltransferase [Candidatus Parcubacteria bacterium]|nr:MAG: undecaprenyldiphospho-muramoylpentapeptide beta-N-acetylglucosaminyltransferase [Candidatus Parcubacteria bacterium]
MKKIKKKIIFSAGGTAGPVSPLLSVAETLKLDSNYDFEFLFVGVKGGVEKHMIERDGLKYQAISGGKLRRYFSFNNFIDPFLIVAGFFQSIAIILKFKPDLVMSAGSFASVPIIWAAWLFRVPVFVHQQDYRPGLANKLMSPLATTITVSFEKSLDDYGKKAIWTGNPFRQDYKKMKISRREAISKFGLRTEKPIVVVMGGGTGAQAINDLVLEAMPKLKKYCQVIHITGTGKNDKKNDDLMENLAEYKYFEFLDIFGVIKVYSVADLIVSRCGMNSLTEISQLGLNAILIPMPDSHQEENAKIFSEANAATVLHQKNLDAQKFTEIVKNKLFDGELIEVHTRNIQNILKDDANEVIA